MNAGIETLEGRLGYSFRAPRLLGQALVHSSVSHGRHGRVPSNERLEFVGDRVLALVVADLIYQRYPDEDEGDLARRLAALVRRDTLARVAGSVGLGEHLVLSAAEEEAGGRDNPAILADACEAVIAALYLDGGLEAAAAFVRGHWTGLMEEDVSPPTDAKTTLQEWAQGRGFPLPVYLETGREGPPHAPLFTVQVQVGKLAPETATGASKRAAEQAAARNLLARLRPDDGR